MEDNILELVSLVATTVAVVVGIVLTRKQGLLEEQEQKILALERELKEAKTGLERELKEAKTRVETLEKFSRTVSTTVTEQRNVIVIGPRASGKSSIVSLWCKLDKLIETLSPTVNFDTYDYKGLGKTSRDFFDPDIQLKRIQKIEKTIRFFDYAGEDRQIDNAVERISESPDCTIVMVFNSDPGYANDNRRYFSRSLVEKINKAFNRAKFETSSVKSVYVVFNKIDLFPASGSNYDEYLAHIKEAFSDNVSNIESIFGVDVEYMVTSARTNHNVVNLLQSVVRSYNER